MKQVTSPDSSMAASYQSAASAGFDARAFVLAGAILGNFASANVLLLYTMGIFISAFDHAYRWARADTALCMTWFTIVIFLGTPLIGRLADRIHPGRLAAVSMFALGIMLVLMPPFIHDIPSLWIAYVAIAIVGLGTSPAVTNKVVVAGFTKSRGLAVGLAFTGGGLGAFAIPRIVSALTESGGWNAGYTGLGCIAIGISPLVWWTLRRGSILAPDNIRATPVQPIGLQAREAIRSSTFWFLSLISLLCGLGISGPVTHWVPFLIDHAASPTHAASIASLLGLSSIAGRLLAGFALDRVNGPLPGLPFLGIGTVGIMLAALLGMQSATTAILLLGIAAGSQFSLIAYFVSRYFGLRAHAALFGWNYGMIALGAAAGPALVGALRDQHGDYATAFLLSGACLGLASVLCPLLGRYRFDI